jgi:phosphonate transport system substrate-binding protein
LGDVILRLGGKNNIKLTALFMCALFFLLLSGCERAEKVSLSEGAVLSEPPKEEDVLKIAVAAMVSPKETFVYYKEILAHVSKKVGKKVKLIQRENYAEVNWMIEENMIDAAFVCSGAYVEGYEKFGMELIAAPKAYGESYYYSYIIVPKDSTAKSFSDLKGKRFAFTDPMSNTGRLVPAYMLARMGESEDTFFSKYTFTYSHDKSIEAVAEGLVDGAAVDSLIWDYANAKNPEFTSKTKIIKRSDPYAIPPVVVPSGLAEEKKEELRNVFLNMHIDPESKAILEKLNIDSFIKIEDSAYDSIREMKKWIEKSENDL